MTRKSIYMEKKVIENPDIELLDEAKQIVIRGGKGGNTDDPADPSWIINKNNCPTYGNCRTICGSEIKKDVKS